MSSPGTYSRCSANSTLEPRNGLRCRPEIQPSTTSLAFSSRPSTRSRTLGSKYRRESLVTQGLASRRRDRAEQVVDQAVRGVALRLRAVRRDQAVAQDGVRDRPDV